MSYTLGIDVSKWQDLNSTPQKMDFKKSVAAGAKYVFIKVSQARWLDEDFIWNWKSAKDAGLPRGGYHFLDPNYKPSTLSYNEWAREQARFFFGALRQDMGEIPAVVDAESHGVLTKAQYVDFLKAFISEWNIQSNKRKLIIYTSKGFWDAWGSTETYWKGFDLWLAQYTTATSPTLPAPWTSWEFWQYTDKGDGKMFGAESSNLDMNRFKGTEQDFYAYIGYAHNPVELTDGEKLEWLWNIHKDEYLMGRSG